MKRSEIKKEIEQVLEKYYHRIDDSFVILSELILNKIEEKGMLPPSTEFKMAGKKYTVNIWEKE